MLLESSSQLGLIRLVSSSPKLTRVLLIPYAEVELLRAAAVRATQWNYILAVTTALGFGIAVFSITKNSR